MKIFLLLEAFLLTILSLNISSCGSSSGGNSGTLNLVLSSSSIASLVRPTVRTGTSCTVSYESTTVPGKCYSPLQIKGIFNQARLGSTSGGTPVRVLGGGSTSGLASVFKKAEFNLKTSPQISGEDNIQDGGGTYNLAYMQIQALEYAFTATSSNSVYNVRIPFTTTPPSANSSFSSCGLGDGLTTADSLGAFYGFTSSSTPALAGDILVCVKSNSSETCADSEYQWVRSDTYALTSTRSTIKQISGTYLLTADSCTSGASHPDITWGSSTLYLSLGSALSISAAISEGVKRYTSGSSSGSNLTLTFDISTSNSLFIPDSVTIADLNTLSSTQVLQYIEQILPKPIYVLKNRTSNATTGSDGMLTASVNVSIN